MAFFSNSDIYDTKLRRKRSSSTTRERPPGSSTSNSSDGHIRKNSISTSVSFPSTESIESVPPLPTNGIAQSTPIAVPSAPTSYDHLSTPFSTTRNYKRESPPPFSNLMVYTPRDDSPPEHPSSPSPASTSASAGTKPGNPSPIVSSKDLPTRSSSLRRAGPLEIKLPKLQTSSTQIDQSPLHVLSNSGKSVSPAAKTSSTFKAHSHTNSSSSSSPVTPMLFAPSHPSSPGHSPTSHSFSSGQGSSRSSLKRALLSAYNSAEHLTLPGLPSPISPYLSGKATPSSEINFSTQAGQSNQKRYRNVLKKPSIHVHRESAAQEITKSAASTRHHNQTQSPSPSPNHRPRAKSITISPTRSGAVFDISQPLPTNALNLTPAGEVQAAYQESQRRSGNIPYNSGKLIAVGVPDCSDILRKKSPSLRAAAEDLTADTQQTHKGTFSVKSGLTRKLSAKWGKTTEKREERCHAPSASVTGLPDGLIHSSYNNERREHVSRPIEALISPRRRELKLPLEQVRASHEENQGRVWEDCVDDWVFNRQFGLPKRDKDVEKGGKSPDGDASSPRRLWRLVKRLSTGNLRERRQPSTEEPPPPVPPLPKDLVAARSANHHEDMEMLMTQSPIPETSKGLMRYISSAPPLTIPQSHNIPTTPKWPLTQEIGPTNSSPRSPTGVGPRRLRSETTRSSSPSSGTTGFFSRSRSSSTSSYGETLPPMPDMSLTQTAHKHGFQRVATTSDFTERLTGERRNAVTARSDSKSPPRRRKSHDISPAGSATIPWFDVQNPINKFLTSKGKRPQYPPFSAFHHSAGADGIVRRPSTANASPSSSKPPVPSRNPKRPSTGSGSVPGHANSRKFSVPDVVHAQSAPSSSAEDDPHSKSRPRSVSDGVVDTPSPASMTFREMTSLKRPLTEAEKAAKWEDLLNRSAKAGGTLHVVSRTDSSRLWSEKSSS